MTWTRRTVLRLLAALAAVPGASPAAAVQEEPRMFGLIGKMTAVPGRRDDLIAVLLAGSGDMSGCLSYIVARDAADEDSIWITEVWDTEASHKASLELPGVREAIAKGRPLIAGFSSQVTTVPVGGVGLRG